VLAVTGLLDDDPEHRPCRVRDLVVPGAIDELEREHIEDVEGLPLGFGSADGLLRP
jgi:hypothetical protein